MTLSIFAIGYILMSLFAALIFYCACVIGAWADDKDKEEAIADYPTTRYRINFRDLAEETTG